MEERHPDVVADALLAAWTGKADWVLWGLRVGTRLEDAYNQDIGPAFKMSRRAKVCVVRLFCKFPNITLGGVHRCLLSNMEGCGRKTIREIEDWIDRKLGDLPADNQ